MTPTNVDARAQQIVADIERDLTSYMAENVIGHQAGAKTLRSTAEMTLAQFDAMAITDAHIHAERTWSCPEILIPGKTCPKCEGNGGGEIPTTVGAEHGVEWVECDRCDGLGDLPAVTCAYTRYPTLWNRFRLLHLGGVGKCPIHDRHLEEVIAVDTAMRLPSKIEYVESTVIVS